jgi:hypothetical protein
VYVAVHARRAGATPLHHPAAQPSRAQDAVSSLCAVHLTGALPGQTAVKPRRRFCVGPLG